MQSSYIPLSWKKHQLNFVYILRYRKEDIHLETNKGSIIVSARKEEKKEEKEGKRYIRRERTFGKVERSFYIGDIDEDNISAEFKDGILKVVIPTKVETEKKQISIK